MFRAPKVRDYKFFHSHAMQSYTSHFQSTFIHEKLFNEFARSSLSISFSKFYYDYVTISWFVILCG